MILAHLHLTANEPELALNSACGAGVVVNAICPIG